MAGKCITSFKLIITNCCSMIVLILFCPTVYTKGFIPTETATTKSINNQSMSHSNRFLSCSTENVNLFYLKGKCINCDNFNYSDKKLSFLNYSTYENCNSLQHEYLDLLSDEDGFILLYNYIILHDCKMQIALPFNNYSSRLAFILVDNRDNNIADASKVFEAVMDNFQSKIGCCLWNYQSSMVKGFFIESSTTDINSEVLHSNFTCNLTSTSNEDMMSSNVDEINSSSRSGVLIVWIILTVLVVLLTLTILVFYVQKFRYSRRN